MELSYLRIDCEEPTYLNGWLFVPLSRIVLMLPGIVSLATIIHPFPDATEAFGRQFQNGNYVYLTGSKLVSMKSCLVHDPACTGPSK